MKEHFLSKLDIWEPLVFGKITVVLGVENQLGKDLSFCHKIYFSNLYTFATQCRRPLIFQTMKPNNVSLKYQSLHHQVAKI